MYLIFTLRSASDVDVQAAVHSGSSYSLIRATALYVTGYVLIQATALSFLSVSDPQLVQECVVQKLVLRLRTRYPVSSQCQ